MQCPNNYIALWESQQNMVSRQQSSCYMAIPATNSLLALVYIVVSGGGGGRLTTIHCHVIITITKGV